MIALSKAAGYVRNALSKPRRASTGPKTIDNDGREQIENNLFTAQSQHNPFQLLSKPCGIRALKSVIIEWE